jgi:hypothetical protein
MRRPATGLGAVRALRPVNAVTLGVLRARFRFAQRSGYRRRVAGLTFVVGGLVLIALGLAIDQQSQENRPLARDFGSTEPPVHPRATGSTGSRLTGPRVIGSRSMLPASTVAAGVAQLAAGFEVATPRSISLPRLGVTAAVQPVAVRGGEIAVPADPGTVGWWQASAPLGAPTGTTVLDGHVDSARDGPGALFHLDRLAVGDSVVVRDALGHAHHYRVYGRRVVAKAAGSLAGVTVRSGPGRLALISCGGPFDESTLSYLDNVIVFAAPTG